VPYYEGSDGEGRGGEGELQAFLTSIIEAGE